MFGATFCSSILIYACIMSTYVWPLYRCKKNPVWAPSDPKTVIAGIYSNGCNYKHLGKSLKVELHTTYTDNDCISYNCPEEEARK